MANFDLGNLVWKITADSADFVRGLDTSDKRLKTFTDRAQKVGTTLSKFVTLPLIGAAGVAVKFASDLAESANAVNVVFGEAAGTIEDFGRTAALSAGLTQTEFNETASILGTLLKQTGQDINTVADATINLAQRAADTGSIFNASAKEVSDAFGAALRGESEPIRRFGVLINEAAVQAKGLELGLGGLSGELTDAEKVQARYALILEQTAEFTGDFANTSDGAANSLRIVKAQAVNLAADLGTQLLPIVQDVLGVIREWTDRFSELDDSQKRLIVGIAAVAAAAGPTITAIAGITRAVQTLNTAALLGPAGAVAGLVALTAAMALLIKQNREIKQEQLEGQFGAIAAATGETVQNLEVINNILRQQIDFGNDVTQSIRDIAAGWGIAEEQVAAVLLTNEDISQQYKAQAREIIRQAEVARELNGSESIRAEISGRIRDSQQATADALRRQQVAAEQLNSIQAELLATLGRIDALTAAGAISEEQALQRKIDLRQAEIDRILDAATAGEITAQAAAQQLATQEDAVERYYDRLSELRDDDQTEELDRISEGEAAWNGFWNQQYSSLEKLEVERRAAAQAEEARIERLKLSLQNYVSAGINPVLQGFEDVGAAIVNNEDAIESLKNAALQGLASVLRALGAELAARAAVGYVAAAFGDVSKLPGAILATAGSAAAYAAAGAISASASGSGGSGGSSHPAPSAPAAPETSAPGPVSGGGGGATGGGGFGGTINFTQNNIVNLDTAENIAEAARILYPAIQAEARRTGGSI